MPEIAFASFDTYEGECRRLLARAAGPLVLPAYDFCMKAAHPFNCLDARGAISVTERARFIGRVRAMAKACAETYVASRARLGFPLLAPHLGALAAAAYRDAAEAGTNAAALAAAAAVADQAPGEARGLDAARGPEGARPGEPSARTREEEAAHGR